VFFLFGGRKLLGQHVEPGESEEAGRARRFERDVYRHLRRKPRTPPEKDGFDRKKWDEDFIRLSKEKTDLGGTPEGQRVEAQHAVNDAHEALHAQGFDVGPLSSKEKKFEKGQDKVDFWLSTKAKALSTRTLQSLHSCLNRAVKRAMARDKVKRNVVELCSVPQGQAGRPSKALTFAQAEAVLKGAEGTTMYAYIVVALLTGARTEELRALTWDHVFLKGRQDLEPPQPPHIAVWRSVRRSGDTKTRKSRRTLALPARCVEALWRQFEDQGWDRLAADEEWEEHGLVLSSAVGKPLDAADVRRAFRQALKGIDGINADE